MNEDWLLTLHIPGYVVRALRKYRRCECGARPVYVGVFETLALHHDEVLRNAMWLCERCAGDVDWGVQVFQIPGKGAEMREHTIRKIEAAHLDSETDATARRLLQYANPAGVLRLGLWTLSQLCGEEPDDLRRQLDTLEQTGIAVWRDGEPILLRFSTEKATPAGSRPAGV